MKQKMQASVVVQFGKPLELQESDIPTPEPGQILERLEPGKVASRAVIDFAKS